ncbi:MAG: hypothetical protein E4H43_05035, partial [Bacteroidia bacterium]
MIRITKPSNILLILILSLTASRLEAQVYLHIDRDKYIAGEEVWFSIYSIDQETGRLSSKSVIAYAELLNPWNIPVIQGRFRLSGGRGEGIFLLPDSISSGTYTIRAYTYRMKDFLPDHCFIHDIDICNPFKGSDFRRKVTSGGSSFAGLTEFQDNNENIIIFVSDSIYGKREKVLLKVRITNDKADQPGISEMSISVTPAEVASVNLWRNDLVNPKTVTNQNSFESEGHILSGRIKYRENNMSDSSDFLFMSLQGKIADFKYARIDTAGRFRFIMPVDSKIRNLILQPEHADNNMILEIEPPFSWILPESYCYKDTLTDSQLKMFSELSFNYQAEKIYGTTLKREAAPDYKGENQKRRFYGIPEMEVFLDDYISLPVMQEVFFELVPGIILRTRKSGYDMKITNPLTGIYYEEPPLVMIDGVIINDLNVLADLDPEKVEKIEVVKTPYLIGDLVLHGIVNVITRSGDFSNITIPDYAAVLPYRVIDKPYTFTPPSYDNAQDTLQRIPD